MHSIVVLDSDLISSFAKITMIDLLETLFPGAQLGITASTYNELLKTKEYGFDILDKLMAGEWSCSIKEFMMAYAGGNREYEVNE